ncbi:unnamed protein product (macronuclear) [Paramecium tetraurelia]|uniref:Chromosome undetermined scaffold_1, whole genome shotgun sequence n=1 Tax=Paramecium tetraurelia TaxID=5888 RepID=Q6BFY3_PARTE|nr:hypothetical protein [Paramecium tetraurelia strain d4-2]XP_001423240.1 uncharacterized protein GSPATT00000277001 [Paramecium tetraurelia]CAH03437.1 hypothetical protein with coiled-coil domains [Paramecium tetraurelia]CAK55842.1 unnamed protein product [Paramecium tetraurelia]|eukprot:XP_001423240.1 hypothetical protein (macronuclear) [Paramecium tetraurelia strain d4-2]
MDNLYNDNSEEEYTSDDSKIKKKQLEVEAELQKLQQMEQESQEEINNLEDQIKQNENKKLEVTRKLKESVETMSQQKQEILILDAKIAFIKRRLNNDPTIQEQQDTQEQIIQDSVYLTTLLQEKERRIRTLKEKIQNIRPCVQEEKQLQQLQIDLVLKKAQLQEIKNQQQVGNLNQSYKNIQAKLSELKLMQEKREDIKQEIQRFNSRIRGEQDQKYMLFNQLQIVRNIYQSYENRVEQQKTMISNLQEENSNDTINQF